MISIPGRVLVRGYSATYKIVIEMWVNVRDMIIETAYLNNGGENVYFFLISNKYTYEWNERSLYGELYIEINNLAFPSEGWTDIISSVLDMWLDNIISLLQSNSGGEVKELSFMDGPYYFKVSGIKDEMVSITLFDHYKD